MVSGFKGMGEFFFWDMVWGGYVSAARVIHYQSRFLWLRCTLQNVMEDRGRRYRFLHSHIILRILGLEIRWGTPWRRWPLRASSRPGIMCSAKVAF